MQTVNLCEITNCIFYWRQVNKNGREYVYKMRKITYRLVSYCNKQQTKTSLYYYVKLYFGYINLECSSGTHDDTRGARLCKS